MKKLLIFALAASAAFAAGSATVTLAPLTQTATPVWLLTYAWTGDASTGSVPSTAAAALIQQAQLQGYLIYEAEFIPGSPSPTASYSVTVTNTASVDVLAGAGASLSATVAKVSLLSPPQVLSGTLTLNLTGNSVASAQGQVLIYLVPNPYTGTQVSTSLVNVSTDPTGACIPPQPLYFNNGTGAGSNDLSGCSCSGGSCTWNTIGGGGGTGNPGGTNNQVQYKVNTTTFGGFTMSGDCTLVVATGVITCTATSGTAFGALATLTPGTGVATFLTTPSSANLAAAVTNETGTGALVFGTAPTITLANGTALPLTTGVTGILPAANGGSGVANTATHTLGSSNQNWATLGTGIVKNTTTTGAISDAAAADVVALFSTCSGTQYLGADGACHNASGSGTVTVVGAGSLISTAIVTGGGTTTVQTPSATATMDSSGNISTPGTLQTGSGGASAGYVSVAQGTAPGSFGANSFGIFAPTSIATGYGWKAPAAAATGIVRGDNSAGTVTISQSEVSGDCTTSGSNAITCTKTSTVAFGPMATTTATAAVTKLTSGTPSAAASADIIGLFTACSGSQYLGADGACHNASGAGTVTSIATTAPIGGGTITTSGTITCTTCVTSAASLTSGALMAGAGTQASQTIPDFSWATHTITEGASGILDASTAGAQVKVVTQSANNNSTLAASTAYVDGKTIGNTKGGTGVDSSGFTGFAKVSGGTWTAPTGSLIKPIGCIFGDVATGSALTTSETCYVRNQGAACTIVGFSILTDAGTATVKTWRVATGGTAIPTVANTISTSGVAISTGTALYSATVTDWTSTAIAANDLLAFNLSSVATAKQITFQVDCQQ